MNNTGEQFENTFLMTSIFLLIKTKVVVLFPKLQSVFFPSTSSFSPPDKENCTD